MITTAWMILVLGLSFFSFVGGLRRVLFGSCNRQNKPQIHWQTLKELDRDGLSSEAFLWTGDSVYAKNNTLNGLNKAYDQLLNSESYKSFVESTTLRSVDGIWDDHDFGVNDAGALPDRNTRAELFTRFLSDSSPGWGIDTKQKWIDEVRKREGLYHVRDFDARNSEDGGGFMKVIFLDTRYARDQHYIPSLGQINLPLTALVAAAIRTASSFLGLGSAYAGSILGEKQWKWLEHVLSESVADGQADYHVIVSSIQVLTTNPAVESWGHFPLEKSRLLGMIARLNPKGVLILSGDVHHGEIGSIGVYQDMKQEQEQEQEQQEPSSCAEEHMNDCSADPEGESEDATERRNQDKLDDEKDTKSRWSQLFTSSRLQRHKIQAARRSRRGTLNRSKSQSDLRVERGRVFEVTSSGLTHTCGDGLITGLLCPLMLNTFTRHRLRAPDTYDGYFIGRNFGQLVFDGQSLVVSVHSIPDGVEVLKKVILPESIPLEQTSASARLEILPKDFFRIFRDSSRLTRLILYCALQYYVYKTLKWIISTVRSRVFGEHGHTETVLGDIAEASSGVENASLVGEKEEHDRLVPAHNDRVFMNASLAHDQPASLSGTPLSKYNGEASDASVAPEDPDGELRYWQRRMYSGIDKPNEVNEVLEKKTGEDGVTVTKIATVGRSQNTLNVEFSFENIPGDDRVTRSQPKAPRGITIPLENDNTSQCPTSKTVLANNNDNKESQKASMRLFFAVSLPPEVKQLIEESTHGARELPRADGDVAIKWTAKHGYHVTIRFIGDTKVEHVPGIIQRMTRELEAVKCGPFDMKVSGSGSFPIGGRPRILWAGLDDSCKPFLLALREAADTALGLKAKEDDEKLNPHVTVARCNANKNNPSKTPAAAAKYLEDNCGSNLQSRVFKVTSIELYLSESARDAEARLGGAAASDENVSETIEEFAGRAGSVYSVLHSFPLDI